MNALVKMPRVTFNSLSKKKASVKKRRTSTITRARYAPKTTRVNRSLIKSNAFAIRTLRRMQGPPLYTDWQLSNTLYGLVQGPGEFTTTYQVQPLMNPNQWSPVLRKDANVLESSSTRVLRMQMNLRYSMIASDYAQFTTFVVSIRKDAANRAIIPGALTEDDDYILSTGQDFNARLNPAVFKVHYVRNVSLTKNTWLDPSARIGNADFAGNPNTTWRKGQVNMKLGWSIRQPLGTTWKDMTLSQFPPGQRLYLITFINQRPTTGVAASGARLDFDALFTCYNTS